MATHIDYYFTTISPFTFLGHDTLMEIAAKHSKQIRFKPFNLAAVWEVSGAVPPANRPPIRQRYRLIELQRVAEFRKLKLISQPTNFPTNPTMADHCVIAIVQAGKDPAGFVRVLGEALWINNQQLADEGVLANLLGDTGHDAATILESAKQDKIAAIRAANSQEAIAADAIGAPAYVYHGEVFWGQDRLEYLDHMVSSGRSAYTS
jgi:2-hydroxychromene-2-carboxylate isomerase